MKYEKKAVCPTMLEKWLDLINSVPLRSGIYHSWRTLWNVGYFELTGEKDFDSLFPPPPESDYGDWRSPSYEQQKALADAAIKATKSLKSRTENFPKLHSYLFKIEDYPPIENKYDKIRYEVATREYEKSAHVRYQTFLQMQLDIREIARSCMEYRKKGYFVDNNAFWEKFSSSTRKKGYPSRLIIKNGIVDFESELIQVLRGIASERLRICPICDEVFWAKRIEASTCSKKRCSNNFHQRKSRIAEYEERFDKEYENIEIHRAKLAKLQAYKTPVPGLIAEQEKLLEKQIISANKLLEKINREKVKNAAL